MLFQVVTLIDFATKNIRNLFFKVLKCIFEITAGRESGVLLLCIVNEKQNEFCINELKEYSLRP